MKKAILFLVALCSIWFLMAEEGIKLPPQMKDIALSKLLEGRESVRQFLAKPLSLSELSSLLWAGQGQKSSSKKRTAPSAGALYPIELYVMCGDVSELKAGIYRYETVSHTLKLISAGDKRKALLEQNALRQDWVATAPVIILISYVKSKTEGKYGERSLKYIAVEGGAVMQNLYLMAQSLGLGTCAVGGFDDEKVKKIFCLNEEEPLLLMPVGHIK